MRKIARVTLPTGGAYEYDFGIGDTAAGSIVFGERQFYVCGKISS